ncbi:hypothetical protein CDAR_369551 [Caerostris darwini]|uniref:Uncharacterized protein n=1 Tax=Caerostris darwini TaxID=1538125 RepID=A0AAV4RWB1_9ARAC|nr:hypothetical protein CDAR_369551 [Caerostris darwini]
MVLSQITHGYLTDVYNFRRGSVTADGKKVVIVDDCPEREGIVNMEMLAYLSDLNPIINHKNLTPSKHPKNELSNSCREASQARNTTPREPITERNSGKKSGAASGLSPVYWADHKTAGEGRHQNLDALGRSLFFTLALGFLSGRICFVGCHPDKVRLSWVMR